MLSGDQEGAKHAMTPIKGPEDTLDLPLQLAG